MTDPLVDALWKKVLDAWEDEAVHGKFLQHCRDTRSLLEAAVRYRGMAGDHARGAAAERRLQGITALALADLELQKSSPARPAGTGTGVRVALILFFLTGSIVLWASAGR